MSTRHTWDFTHEGTKMQMDAYGTFDPDNTNTSIKEVVVMQHGSGRTAPGYADSAIKSAQLHGEKAGEYGVVALDFSIKGEQRSGEPYWTSSGWKQGGDSVDASFGPKVSSFEVMDYLVEDLARNLPNVEKIIFAGHSAGGQFMDRYAAGGDISPLEDAGVDVGFVPANPSSWMFFDDKINYGYGTNKLNPYMAEVGKEKLADNFADRKVAVFAGTKDTINEGQLDTSKKAMAQGDNRWERANNFFDHIEDQFGDLPNHYFVDAPGIGHSGGQMFRSEAGQELLWGDWDMA